MMYWYKNQNNIERKLKDSVREKVITNVVKKWLFKFLYGKVMELHGW